VSIVYFGDGASSKGDFHEGLNFAAIHKLAVVFCIENNLYTQSVPLRLESSVTDLSSRAAGYGIPGVSVDGMDLLALYSAARPAVDRARAGDGPTLIAARPYRYMPNTSNDDDTRYRERAEVERWRERDPIAIARAHLLRLRAADEATLGQLEQQIAEEIADAAAWGEAEPDAAPHDVLRHTWADVDAGVPVWAGSGGP